MKKILLITLLTLIYACSTKVENNSASSRINKSEDNSREIFKELDE